MVVACATAVTIALRGHGPPCLAGPVGHHTVRQAGPAVADIVEDDYSRALAGYAVNLGAPSALTTALAFRQAIWPKDHPDWHVCGIPEVFHVDHGSDFTSAHLEQVMADPRIQSRFSLPGQPRGRGKVERIIRHGQPDVPAPPARPRTPRHQRPGRASTAQPGRTG